MECNASGPPRKVTRCHMAHVAPHLHATSVFIQQTGIEHSLHARCCSWFWAPAELEGTGHLCPTELQSVCQQTGPGQEEGKPRQRE